MKRESSPELAKISALVTRPPKPKATSKRAEDGIVETYPAYPSDTSVATSSMIEPVPRAKTHTPKTHFQKESFITPKVPSPQPPAAFYYVSMFTRSHGQSTGIFLLMSTTLRR